MMKELANVLKSQLTNITFLRTVAGITQAVKDVKYRSDDNTQIVKKMPVSYDTSLGTSSFVGKERELIPNKGRQSILYFEDFGSTSDPKGRANSRSFISNIRIVCWFDKLELGFTKYEDVTAKFIDEILSRLITGTAINQSGILRLMVSNPRVLIQDANIFSRYNYTEETVQYLRPPYDYFAIDLTCKYELRRVPCMGGVFRPNTFIPVRIPILIKDTPSAARQVLDNGWRVPAEYPSGTTLHVPFLKGPEGVYNILSPFVLNNNIVDGIEDDPIPFDEELVTWDFSTTGIAALNDGDEIFINAALPG